MTNLDDLPPGAICALLSACPTGYIHPPLPQWPTPDGRGPAEKTRSWRSADLRRLHDAGLAVPWRKREDGLFVWKLTPKGRELSAYDLIERAVHLHRCSLRAV